MVNLTHRVTWRYWRPTHSCHWNISSQTSIVLSPLMSKDLTKSLIRSSHIGSQATDALHGEGISPLLHTNKYHTYILQTLYGIIEAEELISKKKSGLRIFCRLDSSVYKNAEMGEYAYYPNEVTHSINTGLFDQQTPGHLHTIWEEVSRSLHCAMENGFFEKSVKWWSYSLFFL